MSNVKEISSIACILYVCTLNDAKIVLLYMRCLISINVVLVGENVLAQLTMAHTAILAVINKTIWTKKKRVEQISKALENNKTFDINTVDKIARSLLHYACNKGISSMPVSLIISSNIRQY